MLGLGCGGGEVTCLAAGQGAKALSPHQVGVSWSGACLWPPSPSMLACQTPWWLLAREPWQLSQEGGGTLPSLSYVMCPDNSACPKQLCIGAKGILRACGPPWTRGDPREEGRGCGGALVAIALGDPCLHRRATLGACGEGRLPASSTHVPA